MHALEIYQARDILIICFAIEGGVVYVIDDGWLHFFNQLVIDVTLASHPLTCVLVEYIH